MSTNRSSSGVQNLRAMFEDRDASVEGRSSSPGRRLSSTEFDRKKVTSSFISVVDAGSLKDDMNTNGSFDTHTTVATTNGKLENVKPAGDLISFSGTETTTHEAKMITTRSDSLTSPNDTILEQAKGSHPAESPDKVITSEQEEPGQLKPANPLDTATAAAVKDSSGTASNGEDLGGSQTATGEIAHPQKRGTPLKTVASKSRSSLLGRPTSSPKSAIMSPTSGSISHVTGATSGLPSTRPHRSSLTAQTAASAAKSKPMTAPGVTDKTLPLRGKARSPTRPVHLPSHLTAPTAASAAKHGDAKTAARSPIVKSASDLARPSLGGAKPPTHGSNNKIRAAGTNNSSRNSNVKPAAVTADGGLLSRMMRPTASSSSRAHERVEGRAGDKHEGSRQEDVSQAKSKGHKTTSRATAPKPLPTKGTQSKSKFSRESEGTTKTASGKRDSKVMIAGVANTAEGSKMVPQANGTAKSNDDKTDTDVSLPPTTALQGTPVAHLRAEQVRGRPEIRREDLVSTAECVQGDKGSPSAAVSAAEVSAKEEEVERWQATTSSATSDTETVQQQQQQQHLVKQASGDAQAMSSSKAASGMDGGSCEQEEMRIDLSSAAISTPTAVDTQTIR